MSDKAQAMIDELVAACIAFGQQVDKSSNDTQTDTFVYGKDSKPIPCPFCGEIVKECNDVPQPPEVQA